LIFIFVLPAQICGLISPNTTLSIGVASFSLRFYLYAGATFLAQAKACYSMLWLNDKVVLILLSIGVASFSLRFYLYAGATFLAQAKACYSIL